MEIQTFCLFFCLSSLMLASSSILLLSLLCFLIAIRTNFFGLQHRPGLWGHIRTDETSNYWILVSHKPNCFPQYLGILHIWPNMWRLLVSHLLTHTINCIVWIVVIAILVGGTCCPMVFVLYILIDWGLWASCQGLHYHFLCLLWESVCLSHLPVWFGYSSHRC